MSWIRGPVGIRNATPAIRAISRRTVNCTWGTRIVLASLPSAAGNLESESACRSPLGTLIRRPPDRFPPRIADGSLPVTSTTSPIVSTRHGRGWIPNHSRGQPSRKGVAKDLPAHRRGGSRNPAARPCRGSASASHPSTPCRSARAGHRRTTPGRGTRARPAAGRRRRADRRRRSARPRRRSSATVSGLSAGRGRTARRSGIPRWPDGCPSGSRGVGRKQIDHQQVDAAAEEVDGLGDERPRGRAGCPCSPARRSR